MNHQESTRQAWNLTAKKYQPDLETDVAFLQSGGVAFSEREVDMIRSLNKPETAIHLCCSHGQETLSLLNLGIQNVVGIDFSQSMLDLAKRKSDLLKNGNARWILSPVLETPRALYGSADLVFIGNGGIPWISDINLLASILANLLKPGGYVFVSEGHPLNWIWETHCETHALKPQGHSYFDTQPRHNDSFPASAVDRYVDKGEPAPLAWEYQWTLGQVVTAVAKAGLTVEKLTEYPEQFWPMFKNIADAELSRLPHTYALLAKKFR